MAISAYSSKGGRIQELMTFLLCASKVAVTFVIGGRFLQKKTLRVPLAYCTSKVIGFCVSCLLKASKEQFSKSPFLEFSRVMALYMLFDISTCELQVLATRSGCLSLISQQVHWWILEVCSRVQKMWTPLRSGVW